LSTSFLHRAGPQAAMLPRQIETHVRSQHNNRHSLRYASAEILSIQRRLTQAGFTRPILHERASHSVLGSIQMVMERYAFRNRTLCLSYLDSGGDGEVLIALHGHWMEAATFVPLAEYLPPHWRLIALDQRGHGDSDHAASYERVDYLSDIDALYTHLGIRRAVLLGHSLGGVNAYQFAAKHPQLVQALIIEDIGPTVSGDIEFIRSWAGNFKEKNDLEKRIGPRLLPYVRQSFRRTNEGWRLAFNPADEERSQELLNGDHWTEWLASTCQALVIHGDHSPITKEAEMRSMVERRGNAILQTLPGGHVVHADSPVKFGEATRRFLSDFSGVRG